MKNQRVLILLFRVEGVLSRVTHFRCFFSTLEDYFGVVPQNCSQCCEPETVDLIFQILKKLIN